MNLYVVLISMLIVALQGVVSYQESTFTRRQLETFHKAKERGLKTYPFNLHGGMWSDLLVLPWIFGVAAQFASRWSIAQITGAYLIGGLLSVVMHDAWSGDDAIGAHCLGKRRYTLAGMIHAMYMQAAVAIILLFFLCTRGVPDQAALIVSIAMGLHIFLGMVQPTLMGNGGKMNKIAWTQSLVSAAVLVGAYIWLQSR